MGNTMNFALDRIPASRLPYLPGCELAQHQFFTQAGRDLQAPTHLFRDGLVGKDHGAAGKAAAGTWVPQECDDRQALGEEAGTHRGEGARHLPHHLLGLQREILTHRHQFNATIQHLHFVTTSTYSPVPYYLQHCQLLTSPDVILCG